MKALFFRLKLHRLSTDLPLQLGDPLLSFEQPAVAPKHRRRFAGTATIQSDSRCGLIWCYRRSSAALCSLLRTLRTRWLLNSAVKVRRLGMVALLVMNVMVRLAICPKLSAQYNERLYQMGCATGSDLHAGLVNYFDFYNTERPHQSRAYRMPK